MAAPAETSFNSLLHADSDCHLPDSDADVIAALSSYGVAFKKGKGQAHVDARLDLLSGLLWLHVHAQDLSAAISAASDDQQRRLATALRLDFAKDGKTAQWPTLLSRKILANAAPGLTPSKRKAPYPSLDGQIKKPGEASLPADGDSSKRPRRPAASKGARAAATASDASKSDSDASASAADEPVVVSDDERPAPTACMPPELGTGAVFADLVRSTCARGWVSSNRFEGDLPAAHARTLWRARLWPTKDRTAYEKMIRKQASRRDRSSRREDPNSVACPHRLTFAWSGDAGVALEAQHLAMVCTCESLSDWSGLAGRALGGSTARSVFLALQAELRDAWLSLRGQLARDEHVGAPVISAVFDLLQIYLERRYSRYALVLLPGRLREEVLANVARQAGELRDYFAEFNQSLAERCRRQDYAEQARFAGDRYLALLGPAMAVLLDGDNALSAAPSRPSAGGGPAAPSPAGARRNILLRQSPSRPRLPPHRPPLQLRSSLPRLARLPRRWRPDGHPTRLARRPTTREEARSPSGRRQGPSRPRRTELRRGAAS
jgi:hypothetical protein